MVDGSFHGTLHDGPRAAATAAARTARGAFAS